MSNLADGRYLVEYKRYTPDGWISESKPGAIVGGFFLSDDHELHISVRELEDQMTALCSWTQAATKEMGEE